MRRHLQRRAGRLFGKLAGVKRAFARDKRGGVAALAAILSPVLIGAAGLGGEAGYWYLVSRQLQNAADVAAHATALRANAGQDQAELQALAEYVVGQSDIDITATEVALNQPPLSGAFVEDGAAIEVVLVQTVPRLFSAMYDPNPIQIEARAVATATGGDAACILALAGSGGGQGIDIADNAQVNVLQCDIVSNETGPAGLEFHVDSTVTANCARTAGQAITDGTLNLTCSGAEENSTPMDDPFSTLPEPAAVGACRDKVVENTTLTPVEAHPSGMMAMRFCDGMEIKGNVTLSPGLYIIENGDLKVEGGANVNGNGVVFFVGRDVQTVFDIDARFRFTAPAAGTYAGFTLFGSRAASGRKHVIAGMAGSVLDGTIYTPTSRVEFFGRWGTSFTGCTQIVADDIEFKNDVVTMLHCLFPRGPISSGSAQVAVVE